MDREERVRKLLEVMMKKDASFRALPQVRDKMITVVHALTDGGIIRMAKDMRGPVATELADLASKSTPSLEQALAVLTAFERVTGIKTSGENISLLALGREIDSLYRKTS